MNLSQILYTEILPKVEKPSRYLGTEVNTSHKDPAKVDLRVSLIFPDLYDLGLGNVGGLSQQIQCGIGSHTHGASHLSFALAAFTQLDGAGAGGALEVGGVLQLLSLGGQGAHPLLASAHRQAGVQLTLA